MFNLLSISISTCSGFGTGYSPNWLGNIIKAIIEWPGNIGVGIILFTLALKLLTLGLDIYSRVSMKKNNLKMEKMRPELEKLQRQYANNKELYSQKMQALYKKEGYSMMSSCLPTIVTLVIFIIVMNQFTNYSYYSNLNLLNGMSDAYTQEIVRIADTTDDIEQVGDSYLLNMEKAFNNSYFDDVRTFIVVDQKIDNYNITYKSTDITKLANAILELNNSKTLTQYLVGEDNSTCHLLKSGENYVINTALFVDKTEDDINKELTNYYVDYLFKNYVESQIESKAQDASAKYFNDNVPSFLWVKNVWVPDLVYRHPVNSTISDYSFNTKNESGLVLDEDQYAKITAKLTTEKTEPNGYFILVALSIAVMLLSQLITSKTQKAQLELQSVGGEGAQSSKMMMWMMPIMFGIFAFIYTAAFSIYMVISSLLSTVTTLLINLIVEKSFAKKIDNNYRRK